MLIKEAIEKRIFELCNERNIAINTLANTNCFQNADKVNIYVPDNLVNSYKTATNWSTLADKIKPRSELEE